MKKIHLNLAPETHQKLRIKCAIKDCSMQDFVSKLIEGAVNDVPAIREERQVEYRTKKLTRPKKKHS